MINANIKIAMGGECGLPLIIALKMSGITAVIRPISGKSQVINSAPPTIMPEKTTWNFSLREAGDVISESDILTVDGSEPPNAGLQLRRAISIRAEGKKLLEKHAIAPSAARLCWAARTTVSMDH